MRLLIDQRAGRHGRNIVHRDKRDFPVLCGGVYLAVILIVSWCGPSEKFSARHTVNETDAI